MGLPKIRNLGQYGVITDVDPYDLPPSAFSMAVNARFRNNRVTRGPVFRNVHTLGTSNPRYLASTIPTSGQDLLFFCYQNGSVYRYASGSETNYSISGYTPSVAEAPWSSCSLAGFFYVNRPDRAPWMLTTSGPTFATMVNWPSSTTCGLLKSYAGCLVALDLTESGTTYPTVVRTSSFALAGTEPTSWDYTDPSTNATRNVLAEMAGTITDANVLGTTMIIYSQEQTWAMVFDGSTDIFDYRKLPFRKGAISSDCSIEIVGKHYVFGPNDIWVHDGVSEQSIADGTVRDFVFTNINSTKANRSFIAHNPKYTELAFCFVSGDAYTGFTGAPDGCNRAAVFNYTTNTWTFDDLPLVYSGSRASIDSTTTWATVSSTWDVIGGSWQDQEGTFNRVPLFIGDANAGMSLTQSLYAFDPYGPGSQVSYSVDTNATKGMMLYRDGIDLDDLDLDLQGYKQINYIIPQARLGPGASLLSFTLGSSYGFNDAAVFGTPMTYDGDTLYKLDFGQAGRYLSMTITFNDYHYVSISGFDLDLQVTGER